MRTILRVALLTLEIMGHRGMFEIKEVAKKLNNVEHSINFTYGKRSNNTIHFLDILIIKSHSLTFKVYSKPTNKNNYIHFYSLHNNKIKTGLIIGFNLRVLRICSLQYVNEEFESIKHSLKSLKYPKYFILNANKKAFKIYSSNKPRKPTPLSPSPIDRSLYPLTHVTLW